MFLAVDEAPIPCEFPDDALILVTLHIFDSLRNRFTAPFKVVVDRGALHVRKRAEKRLGSLQPKRAGTHETVYA